jgi:hypothetical protein
MNQHPATDPDVDTPASRNDCDQLCINTIRMLSILEHLAYANEHGVDRPEIQDGEWTT